MALLKRLWRFLPKELRYFIFKIYRKIRSQLQILTHKGDKYQCPFCNYNARDLFVIGRTSKVLKEKHVIGGMRAASGCYKCRSSQRERLIYTYLKEKLDIHNSGNVNNVLHIAPEPNLTRKLLDIEFENYVCGDLFTEGYSYPNHVENMNVTSIPYPDESFDLIMCNHVLEHVPEDQIAMNELRRVLNKEGIAILQVPISKVLGETFEDFSVTNPSERKQVFGQYDHVRIYGQDYVSRLENSGFKVKRVNISSEYPKYGLNVEEDIFVCSRL
ncbi:class I SAM-dependent methyltransferase [Maribacter sp. 2308TA10-17]|uniref:class I SAM-dependent methyltransferase n=1 Tax=Maribacter sp. 2308TA10-17 TaxID=3386276 RepID=UPI0039BD65C1